MYILAFGLGYVRLLTHEGMRTSQYLCFAAVATAPPNPWVFGPLDGDPTLSQRDVSKVIDRWNIWWKTPPSKSCIGYVGRISHPMIGWAWYLRLVFAFLFWMFGEMTSQQPSSGNPKEHREELLKFVPWLRKAQVTCKRTFQVVCIFFLMIGPLGLFVYYVFTIVCIHVFILEYLCEYALVCGSVCQPNSSYPPGN